MIYNQLLSIKQLYNVFYNEKKNFNQSTQLK